MAGDMKEYQLLADGMIVDGAECKRGDTIKISKEHGEVLEAHGSVGPVGILERQAKAEKEAQRLRDEAAKAPDPQTDVGDVSSRRQVRRTDG